MQLRPQLVPEKMRQASNHDGLFAYLEARINWLLFDGRRMVDLLFPLGQVTIYIIDTT